MLDLKRLRLLRELHVRGTIIAVADALSFSPSAVSQQLTTLEKELGVPLLTRAGRHLQLTPAAKLLVAETEQLLDEVERVESSMRSFDETVRGTVRVAAFQTAVLAILPTALRRLRAEYPSVRVQLVQHEPEAALRETWARGFDLVIAEQYPGHATEHFDGLDRRPLIRDRIQLALPPSAIDDPAFDDAHTLADAAGLPWVMEPKGAASRHWAEQQCRSSGFEPDVRYETADLQAHIRLIESGNAVGLLPGLIHAGPSPKLRLIDLPGDPRRTIFTAARVSSTANPALVAFRTILTQVAEAYELTRHSA
ncbi:LysR substrate-binding domain-containing protein [Brooklawnia sp.]|uniref:LysR family transcriptional regulator n=1 Tax=Brooklawnia sp. TaxID=2699740 RepID=UPI00311DC9B4